MSTGSLLTLDLLVAVVIAGTWLGAGAAAVARRPRIAAMLAAGAVTATLMQVVTVVALAGAGWWFVQEKVTLTLPLVGAAGAAATVLAGPRLLRRRAAAPVPVPVRVVVAMLTAGYAAAAGLAVTFLVGYPATWSVALVTVAVVATAGLVTWRVMAPGRSPVRTRLAAGACVMAGLGVALGFLPAPAVDLGGGAALASTGQDRIVRSPDDRPGGQVRRHTLTAQQATVTLASGRQVEAWTFNGQVPGPPLTAVEGDLIEVTLRNTDIASGVTLHWHGYDVPSEMDGAPGLSQEPVGPGEQFHYRFAADQVGTYWYHTHSVSDRGVRMGLYGTLVVTPREQPDPSTLDLTVPVHTFGGVTVAGRHDQPEQHRVARGTPVRLRLVNTDDTPRRFALTGTPFRLVAIDGRDLHQPGELTGTALRLPAGGRHDLAFTMPAAPVALLVGDDPAAGGLRLLPEPAAAPPAVPDTAGWPVLDPLTYGVPAPVPFDLSSTFDRDFALVLDRGVAMVDGVPRYAQTVNGRGHPSIPPQLVAEGDLVRFTVVNRSLETHPWHLHGHAVLVLARDGQPPAGSPLWLDTFDVRPGEVWQVGFRATNPGAWMNHCHNLPHAHEGMMLHLTYAGQHPRH